MKTQALLVSLGLLAAACAPGHLDLASARVAPGAAKAATSAVTSAAAPAGFASATASAPAGTVPAVPASASADPHLDAALALINADRARTGADPLALDPALTATALRHSRSLAAATGGDWTQLANALHKDFAAGDTGGAVAENQGAYPGGDVDKGFAVIHQTMMAEGAPQGGTANHYANLTSPGFTSIGLGLHVDAKGTLWLTELFR